MYLFIDLPRKKILELPLYTSIHFHTLFHPQVYQKHPNNIIQTPLPKTSLLARVFEFLEGKNEKEKKKA